MKLEIDFRYQDKKEIPVIKYFEGSMKDFKELFKIYNFGDKKC